LTAADANRIATGLRQAVDAFDFGNVKYFSGAIPFVNVAGVDGITSLTRLIDPDLGLDASLFEPLARYFVSTSKPDLAGLRKAIGETDPQKSRIKDFKAYLGSEEQPGRFSFDVAFSGTKKTTAGFDLDASLSGLGMTLEAGGGIGITVKADVTAEVRFGIDLSRSDLGASFFIEAGDLFNTIDGSGIAVSVPEASLAVGKISLSAGLLDLSITNPTGSVSMTASATLPPMTLGRLAAQPFAEAVSTSGTGSARLELPASASLLGIGLQGTILVTDTDIYDDAGPVLQLPGLCNMGRLIQLDGGQMGDAFARVGDFLARIRSSGLLDDAIPLVEGISAGNAAKIDKAWEDNVLSVFKPSPQKEAPSTVSQLLDRLAPVLGATKGRYDKVSCTLELDFDFTRALGDTDAKLRFDAKLGGLAEVAAAGNIKVSGVAGLKFTLGFDLNYIVGNDFELNRTTTLESLGIGPDEIAFQYEPDFRITLSTGEQFTVSVNPTGTVGDVLATINALAPDRLVAEIEPRRKVTAWLNDEAKTRLVFDVDPADDDAAVRTFVEEYARTALKFNNQQIAAIRIVHVRESLIIRETKAAGGQGSLRVERLNDSQVASILGIAQSTDTAEADGDYKGRLVIRGPALMQQSLTDSIYLVATAEKSPQITASVEAKTTNLSALANIGIADITISKGEATARLSGTLMLTDPGTDPKSPGRITLAEMIDATKRAFSNASLSNPLGGLNGSYVVDASASVKNRSRQGDRCAGRRRGELVKAVVERHSRRRHCRLVEECDRQFRQATARSRRYPFTHARRSRSCTPQLRRISERCRREGSGAWREAADH
jgi:hypothetical protein